MENTRQSGKNKIASNPETPTTLIVVSHLHHLSLAIDFTVHVYKIKVCVSVLHSLL